MLKIPVAESMAPAKQKGLASLALQTVACFDTFARPVMTKLAAWSMWSTWSISIRTCRSQMNAGSTG